MDNFRKTIFNEVVSENMEEWIKRSVVPCDEVKSALMGKTGGVYCPSASFFRFTRNYCLENGISMIPKTVTVRFGNKTKRCYIFIK